MSARSTNNEWVGGRLPLPAEVLELVAEHPLDAIVWLSLPEDLIVAGEVIDRSEPAEVFGDALRQALQDPLAGPPRRPRRIRVADERLAAVARAVTPDIEVMVAPTPELDAVVELMAASFPGGGGAGYLQGGSISEEAVEDLFHGARMLYTMAPWNKEADQQLLRLDIPELGVVGACVATLGPYGDAPAINVFPSIEHCHRFLAALLAMADEEGNFRPPDDPSEVDFGTDVLNLTFVPRSELPDTMRVEAGAHGWEVAGDRAYPWPQYRGHNGMTWPLGEDFVRTLAALCTAYATFTLKYEHLFGCETFEPVCESFLDEDDLEVRLTMPYDAWSLFDVNEPPPCEVASSGPDAWFDIADVGSSYFDEEDLDEDWLDDDWLDDDWLDDDRLDDDMLGADMLAAAARRDTAGGIARAPRRIPPKPRAGRNDPCPCGSGKKYKRCCLDKDTGAGSRGEAPDAAVTDGLLSDVLSWSDGAGLDDEDWDERRRVTLDKHLGDALERHGAGPADLPDLLGEELAGAMFAWIIEDLMSRRLWETADDRSMIDVFLARKGRRLSERDARYLRALGESRAGLYEVLHARPGEGLVLTDMVAGGEPVEVIERSGSRQLVRWDCIATRVLDLGDRKVLSGAVLHFPRAAAEHAIECIERATKKTRRRLRKLSALADATDEQIEQVLRAEATGIAAPLMSTIWLLETLDALEQPPPALVNYDGEAVVATRVRLPLRGDPAAVREALDGCVELERDDDDAVWSWVVGTDEIAAGRVETLPGGGRPIRGFVELVSKPAGGAGKRGGSGQRSGGGKPGRGGKRSGAARTGGGAALVLETNSRERGERGKKMLEELLGDQLGPGLLEIEDVERAAARAGLPDNPLPPEVEAELRHAFTDRHLHEWLDTEIPALDGKTPRRAVRSKAGRERVLALLKDIERSEHRTARDLGTEPYDVSWMWQELGLAEHRPAPPRDS